MDEKQLEQTTHLDFLISDEQLFYDFVSGLLAIPYFFNTVPDELTFFATAVLNFPTSADDLPELTPMQSVALLSALFQSFPSRDALLDWYFSKEGAFVGETEVNAILELKGWAETTSDDYTDADAKHDAEDDEDDDA